MKKPKRGERADIEYQLQKLDWGLKVLETLLTAPSKGYSTVDMQRLTGYPYDFCKRALYTLKLRGYARQFSGAWKPGDLRTALGAQSTPSGEREPSADVLNLASAMAD